MLYRGAVCQDCLQLLLSLTASPKGVHILLTSGCLQTVARELGERDGREERESLRLLLERLLCQEAVVLRYGEMVEETVNLLASAFSERQARQLLGKNISILFPNHLCVQDEVKFELCGILCSVLETVSRVSDWRNV